MANHSSVTGWQELFFPYKSFWFLVAVANRCFWSIRLRIYRLPNFNMLFQFLLTKLFKSELFSCLQKVDHVTNILLQKAYKQSYSRWITKQFKVLSQTCNFSISSRGIRFSNSSTYLRIDKSYYFIGGHATEWKKQFPLSTEWKTRTILVINILETNFLMMIKFVLNLLQTYMEPKKWV